LVAPAVQVLKLHQERQEEERRTLDLYSHVTVTLQRDALQAFKELLGSGQGSSSGSNGDEDEQDPSWGA
jgi:hypothetical protein